MTFTYNLSGPPFSDLSQIRYHIADTDSTNPWFSDEEINYAEALNGGSWQATVISLLLNLKAKLMSERQITADWLTTGPGSTLATIDNVIAEKRRLFGIPVLTAGVQYIYRPDNTNTTEAPLFDSAVDDEINDIDDDDGSW